MHAIVRQYTYDPAKLDHAGHVFSVVQALHASQHGYAGSLVIDDGRHFIAVNLWETEDDAAAGRAAIGPRVQRLVAPLMTNGHSDILGAGQVVAADPWRG